VKLRASRLFRTTLAAGVVAMLAVAMTASVATASKAPSQVSLHGSVPKWASSGHRLGRAAATGAVEFKVLLKLRGRSAADAAVSALSTPSSSSYHHYLTPAQFRAAYAPSSAAVAAVSAWLRSRGFRISYTPPSGMYVEVTGTVAQAEAAFGTTLQNYSYKGKTLRANTTELQIPSALAAVVSGVVDLDDSMVLTHPTAKLPGPPSGNRYGVQPCSTYYAQKVATTKPAAYGQHQPYAVCGYVPSQYQSAYGIDNQIAQGFDGSGQTVAITDAYAAPTILQDANTYSARHGLPRFKAGQFRQITPSTYNLVNACDPQGWYGEETLDVEAVHGIAPGAKVLYVAGKNCAGGLDRAWADVIDRHLASIVTNSWSSGVGELLPRQDILFFDQFALEAALTGVGVYFSSGDSGDDSTSVGSRQVELPASDPYVIGVGGTSVAIDRNGKRLFETGWGNSYSTLTDGAWDPAPPGNYSSGGGGGTSQVFTQPFYQKGVVPDSIARYFGPPRARAVPDVALPGDPNTGFLVGETQVFAEGTHYAEYRIGGTSLSSPLFAAVMAIADQRAGFAHGFANPALYALAGTSAFHDVASPAHPLAQVRTDYANFVDNSAGFLFRLQTLNTTGSISTRRGYDDVTGVGTPNGATFFNRLS